MHRAKLSETRTVRPGREGDAAAVNSQLARYQVLLATSPPVDPDVLSFEVMRSNVPGTPDAFTVDPRPTKTPHTNHSPTIPVLSVD